MLASSAKRRTAMPKRPPPKHPRTVPTPPAADDIDVASDAPFAEGAHDELSADLRHRLISDAAYFRYSQRGYADGYDMDDWFEAEAEIDHALLQRAG
jgi:hypothetical protein